MTGKSLITFPPLEEGILLRRYKRFLADIELASGEVITAHCANTGPMKGILSIGGRVRVRHISSPTRKLCWTWEQAEVLSSNGQHCWVGVNTSLPNTLIRLAIESGLLEKELGPISRIQREVVYGEGKRSRIDLMLHPPEFSEDIRNIYLEVKNTNWTQELVALLPDTVTERG